MLDIFECVTVGVSFLSVFRPCMLEIFECVTVGVSFLLVTMPFLHNPSLLIAACVPFNDCPTYLFQLRQSEDELHLWRIS